MSIVIQVPQIQVAVQTQSDHDYIIISMTQKFVNNQAKYENNSYTVHLRLGLSELRILY